MGIINQKAISYRTGYNPTGLATRYCVTKNMGRFDSRMGERITERILADLKVWPIFPHKAQTITATFSFPIGAHPLVVLIAYVYDSRQSIDEHQE